MVDTPAIPPSNLSGNTPPEKKEQLVVPPIMWKGKVFWTSDEARRFWTTLSQQVNRDIQNEQKKMVKAMKKLAGDSNSDDDS